MFAKGLTPHDVGLADLLDAARLADVWPQTLILHGAQPASIPIGTELTPPLAAALEPLADAVEADLSAWGHARRQPRPLHHQISGVAISARAQAP